MATNAESSRHWIVLGLVLLLGCLSAYLPACGSDKKTEPGSSTGAQGPDADAARDDDASGLRVARHPDFPEALLRAWRSAYPDRLEARRPLPAKALDPERLTAAVLDGAALVCSGRQVTGAQISRARQADIELLEWIVGYDVIAVIVHEANPIRELSLADLARVFGKEGDAEGWSSLGVEVPACSAEPIARFGHLSSSGVHVYFRKSTLGRRGDLHAGVSTLASGDAVAREVAGTPCGIGYTSLADVAAGTRAVALEKGAAREAVAPSLATAADGAYPLARPLIIYTRGKPTEATRAYIDWILSDDGQRVVRSTGYVPVRRLDDGR